MPVRKEDEASANSEESRVSPGGPWKPHLVVRTEESSGPRSENHSSKHMAVN